MSVLIKGMTMPKTCYDCKLMYDSMKCIVTGTAFNGFNGSYFDFEEGRLPDCPLVEFPSKHGRLFDETEVKKVIEEVHGDDDKWGAVALLEWAIEKRCCIEAED